jgi:outer membrane protein OmpA-like peptidoglycan-associated protein
VQASRGRSLRPSLSFAFAAFAAVVFWQIAAVSAGDCGDSFRGRVQAALGAGDLEAAKVLFGEAAVCDGEYRSWLGNQIAVRMYNAAVASGSPGAAALEDILHYGSPWQVFSALGDIASDAKDWSQASHRYQQAMAEIADPKRTPKSPGKEIILGLAKKAEQAGLLSKHYAGTIRGRDGENEGLAATVIRGIQITTVAMPVEFETAKTTFTEKGRAAALDMADFIKNTKPLPQSIVLIGHADPRGSDALNVPLSLARARALADFLKINGVDVDIQTEGRGSSEPYQPDQASKYTEQELWQMDRRVELVRN